MICRYFNKIRQKNTFLLNMSVLFYNCFHQLFYKNSILYNSISSRDLKNLQNCNTTHNPSTPKILVFLLSSFMK